MIIEKLMYIPITTLQGMHANNVWYMLYCNTIHAHACIRVLMLTQSILINLLAISPDCFRTQRLEEGRLSAPRRCRPQQDSTSIYEYLCTHKP